MLSNYNSLSSSSKTSNTTQTKVAVDSAATGHFFPYTFRGANHNDNHPNPTQVGTADGGAMTSVASNEFKLTPDDDEYHTCTKFVEVAIPLLVLAKLQAKQ